MPFAEDADNSIVTPSTETLPMRQADYFRLVDATGRIVTHGKRARIDPALAPIFVRLGMTEEQWTQASTDFRHYFRKGDLNLKQTA